MEVEDNFIVVLKLLKSRPSCFTTCIFFSQELYDVNFLAWVVIEKIILVIKKYTAEVCRG